MRFFGKLTGGRSDQRSRNASSITRGEELRKLLMDASEFLDETKQRFFALLSRMKEDTLFLKANAILKTDMMLYTENEIVHHLNSALENYETLDGRRRLEIKDVIDCLRQLITRRFFYLSFLERNDGKFDSRMFRHLKRKGLVDAEENEILSNATRCVEEISTDKILTDQEMYRLMMLRAMAKTQGSKSKTKNSTKFSKHMKTTGCFSHIQQSINSPLSHDLWSAIQAKPVSQIRPLSDVMESLSKELFQEDIERLSTEPRPHTQTSATKSSSFRRKLLSFVGRITQLFKS